MKWPLVEIKWVDSCGPHGWARLGSVREQAISRCISVGYLICDGAEHKTLAAHVDPSNDEESSWNVDGVMHIPVVAITGLRVIEQAPAANAKRATSNPRR